MTYGVSHCIYTSLTFGSVCRLICLAQHTLKKISIFGQKLQIGKNSNCSYRPRMHGKRIQEMFCFSNYLLGQFWQMVKNKQTNKKQTKETCIYVFVTCLHCIYVFVTLDLFIVVSLFFFKCTSFIDYRHEVLGTVQPFHKRIDQISMK